MSLLIEEGHAAYGIYWLVLELLRDCDAYKIENNTKAIAWAVHCSDIDLVDRVLHNFGLFEVGADGRLSSPWLCSSMEAYDTRKKKLQEAGRRGAAKRFGTTRHEEGQAIASPSLEEGQAIPYNIMKPDITLRNLTLPNPSVGKVVDVDFFDKMISSQPEGHAPGYVAQVCMKYGMKEETCLFICEHSENAKVTNSTYRDFSALVRRIEAEKFTPKYPDSFFLSKLFEK